MIHQILVNILRNSKCHVSRRYLFKHCPTFKHGKRRERKQVSVTVLGARSYMGKMLSLMLKQSPLIHELHLYSPNSSACGIGLDLAQIDTNTKVKAYFGSELLIDSLRDSNIITVCTDLPESTICESEYLEKVGYIIKNYATFAAEVNPNAIFCIGCPPINSLVPLVSEEYKRAGTYDYRKIIGISMAACCRANSILASNININPCLVRIPILGGLSTDTLVPILSQTKPPVDIPRVLLSPLYKKIIESENEILEEKCKEQTGGCDILYAFASSRFITSLSKAILGHNNIYECAYVKQIGNVGKFLPYMSSLVKLSKDGIVDSYVPDLNHYEKALLEQVAEKLKRSIYLGQSFVTGEYPKIKRVPYTSPICEPPNLDYYVLQANIPDPPFDPCGKGIKKEPIDPHLVRTQKVVKLRSVEHATKKILGKPIKEETSTCKK